MLFFISEHVLKCLFGKAFIYLSVVRVDLCTFLGITTLVFFELHEQFTM